MASGDDLTFLLAVVVLAVTSAAPPVSPKGCEYEGTQYPEGETFYPNNCTMCFCSSGNAGCTTAPCLPPSCVDYAPDPDLCGCPSCPNGNNCRLPNGTIMPAGQDVSYGPLGVCRCDDTQFLMNTEAVCFALAS